MKPEDESVHLLSEQFKASGAVGVTLSVVSKSKRTGSWASITYMKIWVQRQVLVVSILEKEMEEAVVALAASRFNALSGSRNKIESN